MTNILDTVEPDWWDEQGAGPFYSRETVESLLEAHREQVLLEAAEDTIRLDFWISLDSAGREKLRKLLFNADGSYRTSFRAAIDELRRMAEGDKG
jgi:hypothetical protein